jgi:transcriptional regulator with XRE-family HTH domain
MGMDAERFNRDIGRRLRMRRRLLDLTQKEVAERCGLKLQQIHKYESGLNSLSVAKLILLAGALEVSPTYFLDGFDAGLEREAAVGPRIVSVSIERRFDLDAA